MTNDYYVIGGCILYIIGIGFCAYHFTDKQERGVSCLDCLSKSDEYESINYSKV